MLIYRHLSELSKTNLYDQIKIKYKNLLDKI